MTTVPTRLARRLETKGAVIIGIGSMIGAGVFTAAGPAAAAAGSGLIFGVLIAGCLAFLNATTMAQLAAVYPESGGTYVYGRKLLGNYWGFLAGWGFVVGKLASCTAMALTFAYYASPSLTRPLAVGAVLLLTLVNYLGIKKTAAVTKTLVSIVLTTLAIVVVATLGGGAADPVRLWQPTTQTNIFGIFQAAGFMFFAFAGYARIATLGEEVIDPKNSIPKAIFAALAITITIYLVVVTTVVVSVDIQSIAASKAPLQLAIESGRFSAFSPVVRIGACVASLGVLLSLLAGVSRTVFAMAANRDLPHSLSAVHPLNRVPHRAELLVGLIVAFVVCLADLRSAIGFSSFAILAYYSLANIAAWVLPKEQRRWPRWMSALGCVSCAGIAFSLPPTSIVGGLFLLALGTGYYRFTRK